MADNTVLNQGIGGDTVASDDIAGVKYQRVKLTQGEDGVNSGDTSDSLPMPVRPTFITATTEITRPADTSAYVANDAMSNSTSAPTSGGFTFSNLGRVSGGSGMITDLWVTSSNNPATLLQAELWLFETSVTNINDNAGFSITDAEAKTVIGVIPFALTANNLNSCVHRQSLAIGYTCVGSANLRFLIKVIASYTPASAEVLCFRLKAIKY